MGIFLLSLSTMTIFCCTVPTQICCDKNYQINLYIFFREDKYRNNTIPENEKNSGIVK